MFLSAVRNQQVLVFLMFVFALPLFSVLDLHDFGGMELLETHCGVLCTALTAAYFAETNANN